MAVYINLRQQIILCYYNKIICWKYESEKLHFHCLRLELHVILFHIIRRYNLLFKQSKNHNNNNFYGNVRYFFFISN